MRKLVRRDEAQAPEGGFTLVEMVVAISVLAVVVLSVSGVFESGLRALAAAKSRARANEIATQGIEDLQRFSFNNLGLCAPPPGTPPTGLEEYVPLTCGAGATFQNPCNVVTVGTNPAASYDCVDNNITYTVKRYVAWVDALKTTKRLAVFVEWTDLAGNHQVSQQSSLRAPDQSAITGLAPPAFTAQPTLPSTTLFVDETGRLTSSSTLQLTAFTSPLHEGVTTTLSQAIPAHQPNDTVDIKVSSASGFPSYNGYAVKVNDTEVFRVVAGAGTTTWKATAEGSSEHPSGSVSFGGDQVYATVQTLAGNGSPQSSTVLLDATTASGEQWQAILTRDTPSATQAFRFGVGMQYVSFGILRAADGKSTAAFAQQALQICPVAGCPPVGTGTPPRFENTSTGHSATLGSSGQLNSDVTVTAHTKNVTSSDSVTVSFVTQAGTKTIALSLKANTTCRDSATATAGEDCQWVGVIAKADGHRFSVGTQKLYFAAQQVDDNLNPGTIDNGETAVPLMAPDLTLTAS